MIVDELVLQRVARDRRFDARTVEIARHLFLRKEAPRKVAREFALIDKRIYAIRAEVLRQAEKYALPPGCTEVTLRGPPEVIRATERFYRQQMEALGRPWPEDRAKHALSATMTSSSPAGDLPD